MGSTTTSIKNAGVLTTRFLLAGHLKVRPVICLRFLLFAWMCFRNGQVAIGAMRNYGLTRLELEGCAVEVHRNYAWFE